MLLRLTGRWYNPRSVGCRNAGAGCGRAESRGGEDHRAFPVGPHVARDGGVAGRGRKDSGVMETIQAATTSERSQECAQQTLRLIPQFSRWVSAQVEQDDIGGDLSLRQLTVLYYIREQTPTLGFIAKQLMVTPAVVTGIVDRLERRGFVRRTSDAGDRRVVRLTLTESGRKVSIDTEQALIGIVAARLDQIPEDELAALQQSMGTLGRVLADLEKRAKGAASNGANEAAVPEQSL